MASELRQTFTTGVTVLYCIHSGKRYHVIHIIFILRHYKRAFPLSFRKPWQTCATSDALHMPGFPSGECCFESCHQSDIYIYMLIIQYSKVLGGVWDDIYILYIFYILHTSITMGTSCGVVGESLIQELQGDFRPIG